MHFKLSSMLSREKYSKLLFPVIRRYISSNQQTTNSTTSARSFFVRLIEDRRKKIQHDDIRLEPYISKGVYTESGAIRPVSFFSFFLCINNIHGKFRCLNDIHLVL